MVQAIINLGVYEDRVVNVVKGKYGLKNKSEAIKLIIDKYVREHLEPGFRPEFVERVKKAEKGKFVKVDDFEKRYGLG